MKRVLLAAVLSILPASLIAGTLEVENKERLIKIVVVIGSDAVSAAAKIDKLSKESDEDIYLLLNSPGGAVGPGMTVVNSIRQAQRRGVEFKCASAVLAASMAFTILSECDERYVLEDTKLLFHPISLSTRGSRIQELILDLEQTVKLEKRIMSRLRGKLGLSWKKFHRHYFAETFWNGRELDNYTNKRFLTIVDRMEGFGPELFAYRKPGMFFFKANHVRKILTRFEGPTRPKINKKKGK